MKEISLEELLEAGCHFGHQVTRQNPKARDFVFEARDGIHIIDLAKTKEGLEAAGQFVKTVASQGGGMIVVGTKRQAQSIVDEEIKRAIEELPVAIDTTGKQPKAYNPASSIGLFSVTNRWIGGTLTNFTEVLKNYRKLKDITEKLKNDEEKAKYTKKEISGWDKERQKLLSFYGGLVDMKELPKALFIIDTHLEDLAIREAQSMRIPTVGVVDTNADPLVVDHPIPANDDAVGSIKFIVSYIIDAWIEGRKEMGKEKKEPVEEKEVKKAEKTETEEKKEKKTATKSVKEEKKDVSPEAEEKPKRGRKKKTA